MAAQHGITATTYQNLIIDSGAIYKNYGEANELLIGATRGGNTFTVEQEIREMEVDGAHGAVINSERVVRSAPKIVANIIEFSADLIQMAFPGSTTADFGSPKTHDAITRAVRIASTDYFTNITIIGETTRSASQYVQCSILNALSMEGFELSFTDKEETVATVTFMGHFAATDLATEPWRIRYPVSDA